MGSQRVGHDWVTELNWTGSLAVRNLLAMQETRVQSLGQKDPPEKEMATHSSILAREIPWLEEPGRLQSLWSQRVRHNWLIHHHRDFHKGVSACGEGGFSLPFLTTLNPKTEGRQGSVPGWASGQPVLSRNKERLNKEQTFSGFPGGSGVKNPPANARATGLIPDLGGSHLLQSN